MGKILKNGMYRPNCINKDETPDIRCTINKESDNTESCGCPKSKKKLQRELIGKIKKFFII